MNRPISLLLLATLAGPALAGNPPSHPQAGPARAAAELAPLIAAHRVTAMGSTLLPLRLAPAPRARLCIPRLEPEAALDRAVIRNRTADARRSRGDA